MYYITIFILIHYGRQLLNDYIQEDGRYHMSSASDLRKCIDEISTLKQMQHWPPQLNVWRNKTIRVLSNIYGDKSLQVEQFKGISYHPPEWYKGNEQDILQHYYVKGLDEAYQFLTSLLSEPVPKRSKKYRFTPRYGRPLLISIVGGIAAIVIGGLILNYISQQPMNEDHPDVIIDLNPSRGRFVEGTNEYRTEYRSANEPFVVTIRAEIINQGKGDAHNVCLQFSTEPSNNGINFNDGRFLKEDKSYQFNQKDAKACMLVLFSKERIPTEFRITFEPIEYDKYLARGEQPIMKFTLGYEELETEIVRSYPVRIPS